MTQQRNDDGLRNQSPGAQGGFGDPGHPYGAGQQGGQYGASSGGQQGGGQAQHSQYSDTGRSQYGAHGGAGGAASGGQYGGGQGQIHGPGQGPGEERQWGHANELVRHPGEFGRDERQFTGHYGAVGDPFRSGGSPSSGWSPQERQGGGYGGRGFGATGHGASGYSGLGTFYTEPQERGQHFDRQQFDQFGREQFGVGQGSGQDQDPQRPHRDPHYQQWRAEQLRRFDEDYEQWHQDRYQRFSKDFDEWRAQRQNPASNQGQTPQQQQPGNGGVQAGRAAAGSEGGDLLNDGSEIRSQTPDQGSAQGSAPRGGKGG